MTQYEIMNMYSCGGVPKAEAVRESIAHFVGKYNCYPDTLIVNPQDMPTDWDWRCDLTLLVSPSELRGTYTLAKTA